MRVAAFYPIHYGTEYLEVSIKSIEPLVEKIFMLYTSTPSYGYNSDAKCPETREQIKAVAEAASSKVTWVDIFSTTEGFHRDLAFRCSAGYDVLVACDSDEVWDTEDLKRCIQETYDGKSWRRNVNGFINFWKSFNMVCIDGFQPARLYNLNVKDKSQETISGKIYHFGCAQSKEIMDYKYEIHGHKSEIRPNWLNDIYYKWKDSDRQLHPVSLQIWDRAEPFDKTKLPEILKQHKNYGKDVI